MFKQEASIRGIEDTGSLGIKAFFVGMSCSAVRRREFEEVGGFPERIIMNEDMVLAARMFLAGCRVAYESSAMVRHSHNYSLWEQFKRYFGIGAALKQAGWQRA